MDIHERFFKYVEKTATCWLWNGCKTHNGYGKFSRGRAAKNLRSHRVSYELHKGQIPKGMLVLHTCDVRNCVNPEHLFLGTERINTQDMISKNRVIRGSKASWSKISESDVIEIRNSSEPQDVLAKRYGLCQQSISSIKLKKNWKHLK